MKPVIVIGGGGHAGVLISLLKQLAIPVLGYTDPDATKSALRGISRLGTDEIISDQAPGDIFLVNGIGSINTESRRSGIYKKFKEQGYVFLTVVHPEAVVAAEVELSEGVQIMAGAVVQAGCCIGEDTLINSRAVVDHDTQIAGHVHVAPGAILCGSVNVGENALIGAGATVVQGVRIGKGTLVGAGSLVLRDIGEDQLAYGVPAQIRTPHL